MTALEYSPVVVPFAHGLGHDTDPRMRPAERLQTAENVFISTSRRLEKRKGYTRLSRDLLTGGFQRIDTNGPVRGLAFCGDELLAVGHRELFGYIAGDNKWVSRGAISPCVGRAREVFRAHGNYECGDVGKSGTYYARAASRFEDIVDAATDRFTLEYEVLDANGVTVKPRTTHASASVGADKPRCPRLVNGATHVAMYWIVGANSTPGTLKRAHMQDSAAAGGFTSNSDVTTDLYLQNTLGTVARTFDACQMPSGGNYVEFAAWVDDSSRDIALSGIDSTGTQQQSSTITGTFSRVAVGIDAAGTNVYVLAVTDGANDDVVLYARRRSDLSAQWGPITIYSGQDGELIDNLGVVEGVDSDGVTRVMCTWIVYRDGIDSDGANTRVQSYRRTTDTSGGSLTNAVFAYNLVTTSRPFVYRNRFYQEATVWLLAAGFCSRLLVDLGNPSVTGDAIRMAAQYDVGIANVANLYGLIGSTNNVVVMADGVTHRHAITSMVEAESATDTSPRIGIDEAEYTFDVMPLVASVPGPSAVVGGGYVSYYDGGRTFELGFAAPPVLDSSTSSSSAGGVPDGTYTLMLHWAHVDARGALHRSLPSPPLTHTVSGGPKIIEVEWRTLPCSRRPAREVTAQYYRAGTDGIAYRRWQLGKTAPNKDDQYLGDNFIDTNLVTQTLTSIYTTGGVLEAVAPEGARLPLMTRERLWLGGFFRADRIQYSKTMTPQTSGDQVIAPEMMEALGRLIPSGEQVTGLGELGQDVAIFTEKAIYVVTGEGPDARGAGDNMSRMHAIPVDDGCIDPRSVASFEGGILYRGKRGFNLLDTGYHVQPIGEPARNKVDAYTQTTSACVIPGDGHVRWTIDNGSNAGIVLVFDYLHNEWFSWTIYKSDRSAIRPVGGTVVDGIHYVLDSDGYAWKQSPSAYFDNDGSNAYQGGDIKSAWIQPAGPGTFYRLGRIVLLADRLGVHELRVNLYTDYNETSPAQTWNFTAAQIAALPDPGNLEEFNIRVPASKGKARAFMIEMLDVENMTGTGAGFRAAAAVLHIAGLGGPPRSPSQGMA